MVGGPALLREQGIEPPRELAERTASARKRGESVPRVVRAGEVRGALAELPTLLVNG
jgi:P-type Cu2+ transporter